MKVVESYSVEQINNRWIINKCFLRTYNLLLFKMYRKNEYGTTENGSVAIIQNHLSDSIYAVKSYSSKLKAENKLKEFEQGILFEHI